MKRPKRTKDDPAIIVNYLDHSQRRICCWTENGKNKREYYSRWLWERTFGKIPDGYVIYYKDHNPLNDCIENYEIITRSEYNKRWRLKQYDKLDNVQKNKYIVRWNRLKGFTALEKINSILPKYGIENLHQLSGMTGIDKGQLSRIKNKNSNLEITNIKRLFDTLDKL